MHAELNRASRADMLGMQEVLADQTDFLREKLPYFVSGTGHP